MEDLIARLEAATGPDRELDCLIDVAVGHPIHNPHGPAEVANWPQRASGLTVPAYTASIDAAMTLVPDGSGVMLFWFGDDERTGEAQVANKRAKAAAPALALCIAALKVRAQTPTTLRGGEIS